MLSRHWTLVLKKHPYLMMMMMIKYMCYLVKMSDRMCDYYLLALNHHNVSVFNHNVHAFQFIYFLRALFIRTYYFISTFTKSFIVIFNQFIIIL
jgi:hypothetical protein